MCRRSGKVRAELNLIDRSVWQKADRYMEINRLRCDAFRRPNQLI